MSAASLVDLGGGRPGGDGALSMAAGAGGEGVDHGAQREENAEDAEGQGRREQRAQSHAPILGHGRGRRKGRDGIFARAWGKSEQGRGSATGIASA